MFHTSRPNLPAISEVVLLRPLLIIIIIIYFLPFCVIPYVDLVRDELNARILTALPTFEWRKPLTSFILMAS